MPLSKRLWQCPPVCQTEHERDINAALNIRQQGLFELQAAGFVVSAHGGQRKICHAQAKWEAFAQWGGEQSQER